MDPHAEFLWLIEQTTEHLRYYRELGITHIGGAPVEVTAPASAVAPAVAPTSVPPHSSPTPGAAEKQVELMAKTPGKKAEPAAAEPSLFGDLTAPPVEAQHADETLADIRAEMGDCRRCKLWRTRTKLVFGEGSPRAELMFVGEAPGADEDLTGRPFVGRAGQLLTKMIEAIGLKREEVYIANVLKSRPPNNRNPEKDEIEACLPFLYRQIAAIRPRLIVTLGNPATQELLETKTGISKMRGEFQDYPRLSGIKVLPTFHPAYLLRSPDKKREAWEDLKKVRAFLSGELQA
jgi:uracil-DNA glycosylase family 4